MGFIPFTRNSLEWRLDMSRNETQTKKNKKSNIWTNVSQWNTNKEEQEKQYLNQIFQLKYDIKVDPH